MTVPAHQRRGRPLADLFHNEVTAWIVLAVSLVVTVLAWYIADRYSDHRANERFTFEVEDARQRIADRMTEYEQVLRGGVALFDSIGRRVTREEWHRYVTGLDIQTRWPGIQGIGYAAMFPPDQLTAHEAAIRAEGFPNYRISPEGERADYSAIIYLEPFDWRNRRAFGYDMFSEPVRRAAMERARDTDEAAVSGRVTLVQETDDDVQAGFLVYLPHYHSGMPINTVEERRAALAGFVYSPFRIQDLMHGILGSHTPDLGFELYDGTAEQSAATRLYTSNPETVGATSPGYGKTVTIDLTGRTWTARFHSRPSFDAAVATNEPIMIAIGGVTVDIMLFTIIWSLAGERRRVRAKAEAMTAELAATANRLQLAQHSASIGTWDYDLLSGALLWDKTMFRLFGVDPVRFDGTFADWERCVHSDDLKRVTAEFQQAIAGEREFHVVFRILRNGDVRVLEGHGTVQRAVDGTALRVTGINRDITERARIEERLRLAASVFDHAHEGIAITDANERIVEVNPTFTELTGYSREEVLGKTPRILKSGQQDTDFYTEMWRCLLREGYWRGELRNRRKNGDVYPELMTISAVQDPEGEVTHYVGIFSDITVLKEHQQRLERLAHFDALTRLPNRVLLADRMGQAMAQTRRRGRLLGVCYLDLDGFKPINDQYGHEAGDQLLIQVAERLTGTLRESDSAARLGGDEFVLLLNNLRDVHECEQGVERLLRAMAAPYGVDGHRVTISASIGVTLFPDDDSDADTLLRHADQAMYMAKQAGRNRYWLFDPEHDRAARAHREAITRIEAAFANDEFRLHYQPKVDMRSGTVIGVEALIRWQHPEQGLLPPVDFLPVIEASELGGRLGEWVLREALGQLTEWRAQGLDLMVGVNISGDHLQQPDFARKLGELLAEYPSIPADRLELEVLETTALEDIAVVSRVIDECRALGVTIALDDFGTGYSSLTYLKRLPADTLKIDQSFVRDMLTDPDDLSIIEGIIGLTQAFRRSVIAEGVESEEHGTLLLRLGCDLAQGYGIARPMPAGEVPQWMNTYRQPDAWVAAARVHWPHEDFPLLSAELEHRRWVDDLITSLDSGSDTVPAPPMDTHRCRFGQWYHGPGRDRHGKLPEFAAIAPVHEAIHRLGAELLALEQKGQVAEAQRRIPELLRLRAEIISRLHALQAFVSADSEMDVAKEVDPPQAAPGH